jgi:hypothetical protein
MYTSEEVDASVADMELVKKRQREDEVCDENCTQPCGLTTAGHSLVRGREIRTHLPRLGIVQIHRGDRQGHTTVVNQPEKLLRSSFTEGISQEKTGGCQQPKDDTTQTRLQPTVKQQWSCRYLDFYKELSAPEDTKLCLVYVYEIKGKPYVNIANCAPFSHYKRLRKPRVAEQEQRTVSLNLGSWAELCSVVTHTYVTCAIDMCTKRVIHQNIQRQVFHRAVYCDSDNVTKCVTASYNMQTGAYERNIGSKRNIAVKLIDEVVYVIVQETVWDAKLRDHQIVREMRLKTSQWKELVRCMSDVNNFLSKIED